MLKFLKSMSLVEILVAVSIIFILVSLAVPLFFGGQVSTPNSAFVTCPHCGQIVPITIN